MDLKPRLIDVRVPRDPAGAVLVLHGGASRRANARVSPTQLSVVRMIPIARRIARAGRGELAVFRLLNAVRGWGTGHTPVHDARWALAEIADRVGDLPVCVVGHSLGGRAAILTAGEPAVRGVCALNPYVYATDVPRRITAERIRIVHGTEDRVASPQRAFQLAQRLGAEWEPVEGGKHAMLRHHGAFSGAAAAFARETLLARAPHA